MLVKSDHINKISNPEYAVVKTGMYPLLSLFVLLFHSCDKVIFGLKTITYHFCIPSVFMRRNINCKVKIVNVKVL